MDMKEQIMQVYLEQLDKNLKAVEEAFGRCSYNSAENRYNQDPKEEECSLVALSSTPMDAIEKATRCISRADKPQYVEMRQDPQFKEAVMRRVMETLQRCKLNDNTHYMTQAGQYHASAAEYFSDRLKGDQTVALNIVEKNSDIINYMTEYFSPEYPETFFYAAERNPDLLQNPECREHMEQAAKKYPDIFRKKVDKLIAGMDSRAAKEARLAELQERDKAVTGEIEKETPGIGNNGRVD